MTFIYQLKQMTEVRLSSSLRARNVSDSIALAIEIAKSRGISRVVDTTWLDRIGIPVFASIRPDGAKGTLCVHAGKGYTSDEAKIGAYMEAIEFSFAQPGRNVVPWSLKKPMDVLKSFHGNIQFSDFAPRLGKRISVDDEIAVVEGTELLTGLGMVLVPAELVYHPFFENPGVRLYGTTTNGLASGNTVDEATVHGLAEVMERHVRSFEILDDNSTLVRPDTVPPRIGSMISRVEMAGLRCHLRFSTNPFGLPYFSAYVLERDEFSPISVGAGFGLHPISDIAAVRAIAEAVQGRLSHIHGGRDDIIKRVDVSNDLGREAELLAIKRLREIASRATDNIAFADIPTFDRVNSISSAQQCLLDALWGADLKHVVRVVLSPPGYPFAIVKVLVPGAEMYEPKLQRVGPRILKEFQNGR